MNSRDAAALTRWITRCKSSSELEQLVHRYQESMNHIHVAAAIVKLAKLSGTDGAGTGTGVGFGEDAAKAAAMTSDFNPHSTTQDTAGAVQDAHRQQQQQTAELLGPPHHRARRREHTGSSSTSSAGNPHGSRNTRAAAEGVLSQLVSSFVSHSHEYDTARQFANVVWALGNLRAPCAAQLLPAASSQLLSGGGGRLASALPQELSNLALGLAKLQYRDVELWNAIIASAKRQLHSFKPQELHNLAWAVAAARQDRSMIAAVVQEALPQLHRFNASGLANLLWACAAAQCPCGELFDAAAALLLRMPDGELNSQDVANVAWAFAKLQHPHPQLASRLCGLVLRAGPRGLRRCSTVDMCGMAWAFVSMSPEVRMAPEELAAALAAGAEAAGRRGGAAGEATDGTSRAGAVGWGNGERDGEGAGNGRSGDGRGGSGSSSGLQR